MGKKRQNKQSWLWEFSKKIVWIITVMFVIEFAFASVLVIFFPDSTAIQFVIENISDVFKVTVVSYAIKAGFENVFKIMGITDKKVTVDLNVGDKVKITDGPFKLMLGKVLELDEENSKATVSIDLFGQETTVEVSLTDVELDK